MNNIFHQVLSFRQINIHLDSIWRASDCVKYTRARDTTMMPWMRIYVHFSRTLLSRFHVFFCAASRCHVVAPFISAINKNTLASWTEKYRRNLATNSHIGMFWNAQSGINFWKNLDNDAAKNTPWRNINRGKTFPDSRISNMCVTIPINRRELNSILIHCNCLLITLISNLDREVDDDLVIYARSKWILRASTIYRSIKTPFNWES